MKKVMTNKGSIEEKVAFYRLKFNEAKGIEDDTQRLDSMNNIYKDYTGDGNLYKDMLNMDIGQAEALPVGLSAYVSSDTKPLRKAYSRTGLLSDLSMSMIKEIATLTAEAYKKGVKKKPSGEIMKKPYGEMGITFHMMFQDPYIEQSSKLFARVTGTVRPEDLDRLFTI